LVDRFKAQHHALNCRDLLGRNLNTPEGRKTAREKRIFGTVCKEIVTDAAKIVNEILAQQTHG
jgi:hypothetical protein